MPVATLKLDSIAREKIDVENGILFGCQLARVGVIARFTGAEGKPVEIEITPTLIGQLAQLASGKSISAHWSHDYIGESRDSIHSRIGAWKNVRTDDSGNLVGDLHLMPSQYREAVLWLAQNTPDGAGMSAVFEYNDLGNRFAYPISFKAADLVSQGACTDAFFAKHPIEDMTKDETVSLIKDTFKVEIAAALKDFKSTVPAEEINGAVTAALAHHKPKLSDEEKAEIATLAEAKVVAKVGTHGKMEGVGGGGAPNGMHAFLTKVEAHKATGASDSKAILRAQNDHPELYNDWMKTRHVFKS